MKLEERIETIERRLACLERRRELNSEKQDVIKIDLVLPEATINGLHFNEQKVHAVFELQKDGWYHSRDILFISARNTKEDNSHDFLFDYLNAHFDGFKGQIARALNAGRVSNVEIGFPKENLGVKQYNGVNCSYWLADKSEASNILFRSINIFALSSFDSASYPLGVAPVFRVRSVL